LGFAVERRKGSGFAETAGAVLEVDGDQEVVGVMLGAAGDTEGLEQREIEVAS
jgi:hypothetical protein